MNYIIDTTILIDLARGNEKVARSLSQIDFSGAEPFITLLTYSEYYFGFLSKAPKEIEGCMNFLRKFNKVTITEDSARTFAELNYKYKRLGIAFGTMDLLNASIAIQENMILVTTDKQFEKIAELKKIMVTR